MEFSFLVVKQKSFSLMEFLKTTSCPHGIFDFCCLPSRNFAQNHGILAKMSGFCVFLPQKAAFFAFFPLNSMFFLVFRVNFAPQRVF